MEYKTLPENIDIIFNATLSYIETPFSKINYYGEGV